MPKARYAWFMIWDRFRLYAGVSFALALCVHGCSSASASSSPVTIAGQGNISGAGGAFGAAGSAVAGDANSVGGYGASGASGTSNVGGAAGAQVGGGVGASGSAGAVGGFAPCHARPGLLACDDFESATLGGVPGGAWSAAVVGAGTVAVDDSVPAHSGSKAVHVHGADFQTLLVYHDAAVLPQASGRFYVRAFVRLAEAMVDGHNTFVIADLFATPGTGNALRLGEQNGMLMMTVGGDAHGYLSNQNYYNDHKPGVVFKAADYSCLELLLDSPHTEIQVWVDGVDVPDLHVSNLAHENYDALRFGFEKYAGPVSDVWYDDIAFGSEPIGCD